MSFRFDRKHLSKPIQAMLNEKEQANKKIDKNEEPINNNPIKYVKSKGWQEINLEIHFDDGHRVYADLITPDEINNYIKLSDDIEYINKGKSHMKGEAHFKRGGLMNEYGRKLDYMNDEHIGFEMNIIKNK